MSVVIDSTDFVQAPEGSNSLRFTDDKQQANFELGVSMVVHSWNALEIAVANQWGGGQSEEKRDWITAIVVDLFNGKAVDIELIEETILNAMADEFDVHVEDDSSLPIADKVIKVYRQCAEQDYTTVRQMFDAWQQKQNDRAQRAQQFAVNIQADPNNPDSSDDEDEDDEDEHHEHVPQLQDDDVEMGDAESQGPIIDDDGFELVQKKGKRRN